VGIPLDPYGLDSDTEVDLAHPEAPNDTRPFVYVEGRHLGDIDADDHVYEPVGAEASGLKLANVFASFQASIEIKAVLARLGITSILLPRSRFNHHESIRDETSRDMASLILAKMLGEDPAYIDDVSAARDMAFTVAALLRLQYEIPANPLIRSWPYKVSDVYVQDDGRPALVATSWDDMHPSLPTNIYRSNSYASCRVLLAKSADGLYVKGMFGDETSANAPLNMQRAFAAHEENKPTSSDPLSGRLAEFIVPRVVSEGEYYVKRDLLTFAEREMRQEGMVKRGAQTGPYNTKPGTDAPEEGMGQFFARGCEPNFNDVLNTWEFTSNAGFYDRVTARIVPSLNGLVHYQLHEAHARGVPQYWIATAEYTGKKFMTKYGIPSKWVSQDARVMEPPIDYDFNEYGQRRHEATAFDKAVIEALRAE
jgi:hypothetical protein